MYQLHPKFEYKNNSQAMLVNAAKNEYKTFTFDKKPLKEEVKKIILEDAQRLNKQKLPLFNYVLSKDNEEFYLFDTNGCMIKNYKFEKLIKKTYSPTFLLDLKGIEEFEEDYLQIKDYLSSFIYADELIKLSYHFAPKKSANKKQIIKTLKSLNIENEELVDAIFHFIMAKRHKKDV